MMMLAYLKFWIQATDQHGVHSPFIYGYVTWGLYKAPRFGTQGALRILLQTLSYFNLKEIQWVSDNQEIEQQIRTRAPEVAFVPVSDKLIYLDPMDPGLVKKWIRDNDHIQNDTLVFIPNIYQGKERRALWESLKEMEVVTVSVDMFYGGILFFRKEQAKEHFKIRI